MFKNTGVIIQNFIETIKCSRNHFQFMIYTGIQRRKVYVQALKHFKSKNTVDPIMIIVFGKTQIEFSLELKSD